jgi:hypothetical protein
MFGHLIGSECLQAMQSRGFDKCSFCSTAMKEKHNLVHLIIRWLAKNYIIRFIIDLIVEFRDKRTSGGRGPDMSGLSGRVLARIATPKEAKVLRRLYMLTWLWANLLLSFSVLPMWLIMSIFDYLCGTYAESVLVSSLVEGRPSYWAIAINVLIHVITRIQPP